MVKKLNSRKEYRGAATVEFALVLPLLLLLTMGAIRYGHLFLKKQQLTNAARHGARTMILPDATATEVQNGINSLLEAANIVGAQISFWAGQVDENGDVVLNGDGTVAWIPATFAEQANTPIMVRIVVPSANVDVLHVPLFTDLEPDNWNLGASVAMAKEGF